MHIRNFRRLEGAQHACFALIGNGKDGVRSTIPDVAHVVDLCVRVWCGVCVCVCVSAEANALRQHTRKNKNAHTYVFLASGVVLAVRTREGSLQPLVELLESCPLARSFQGLWVERHQHVGVRLVVELACAKLDKPCVCVCV